MKIFNLTEETILILSPKNIKTSGGFPYREDPDGGVEVLKVFIAAGSPARVETVAKKRSTIDGVSVVEIERVVVGLPFYSEGWGYIVTPAVHKVILESGRRVDDLFLPGERVGNFSEGSTIGCLELKRVKNKKEEKWKIAF